jgi:hypothetical protein
MKGSLVAEIVGSIGLWRASCALIRMKSNTRWTRSTLMSAKNTAQAHKHKQSRRKKTVKTTHSPTYSCERTLAHTHTFSHTSTLRHTRTKHLCTYPRSIQPAYSCSHHIHTCSKYHNIGIEEHQHNQRTQAHVSCAFASKYVPVCMWLASLLKFTWNKENNTNT